MNANLIDWMFGGQKPSVVVQQEADCHGAHKVPYQQDHSAKEKAQHSRQQGAEGRKGLHEKVTEKQLQRERRGVGAVDDGAHSAGDD